MASNMLLGAISSHSTVFSKLIRAEPITLLSPLLSPVGSVRSKQTSRRQRFRPIYSRLKEKEFPVDKRLPVNYVFRLLPTALSHPGDINKNLGVIDSKKPKLFFEESKELQTANEDVKRLFSLEMGTKCDLLDSKYEEMRQLLQRHPLDNYSHEVDIGSLTVNIRHRLEKFSIAPHNKFNKVKLHSAIRCRNKLLNRLYRIDEERYKWVLKTLEINHQPPKLGMIIDKPTRKTEIQRLTEEYCDNIRSSKIEAYRQQLKSQQEAFLEEKAKTLELIEKEEKIIEEKRKQIKSDEELWWKRKDVRSQ